MADIDNNLPIETAGVDAEIGTDIFQNSGTTAHAQIVKIAWGDQDTVNRATAGTPLPVQVYGITGNTPTITVTGSVRGLGNFSVTNTASAPVYVTGGVVAYVNGVKGAEAVTVTGGVNILSSVGITGVVNVTGGRRLDQSIDSILIGGTAARNWNLTSVDVVRILDSGGGTVFGHKIMGASGTNFSVIGACGDALKVAIVNTGFSASITFGSVVSVQNDGGSALRVQGTANGTPIRVEFASAQNVNVTNTDGVNIDSLPASSWPEGADYPEQNLYYGLRRSGSDSDFWQNTNNIEKLLLGQRPGTNKHHTAGQWLGYLWQGLVNPDPNVETVLKYAKSINSQLSGNGVAVNTTVNYSFGNSIHAILSSDQASVIDNGLPGVQANRQGLMYVNHATTPILLLAKAVTDGPLFNPNTGFSLYTGGQIIQWNGAVINPDTVVNGNYPYYKGYLLGSGASVILPFIFFSAIAVSNTSGSAKISNVNLTVIY